MYLFARDAPMPIPSLLLCQTSIGAILSCRRPSYLLGPVVRALVVSPLLYSGSL